MLSAFQHVVFFIYIHLILNDLPGITEGMKLRSKEVAYLSISRLTSFF